MRFGSRDICDVTFRATTNGQKVGKKVFKRGQPAFFIDTAKTSNLEQATTTVYAQGGRGYVRLLAWEGEKTMTFTVEDALISPQGMAVLSGAGLLDASDEHLVHFPVNFDGFTDEAGAVKVSLDQLKAELGLHEATEINICQDPNMPVYAAVLDGAGAAIDYLDTVELTGTPSTTFTKSACIAVAAEQPATFTMTGTNNKPVRLSFYVVLKEGATEINISAEDFGGYFYIEAATLYRDENGGKDLPATIVMPKVKVQSNFTFTMSASGDPSTFTFTMDALPGYSFFDQTKKIICGIQIVGVDESNAEKVDGHSLTSGKLHTVGA